MKETIFVATLALAVIAGPGCPPSPKPPPSDADAGIVIVDRDAGPATCERACAHARDIHCPVGDPTPKGASCEVVCGNVQDSGSVAHDLACWISAASCARLNACR